ncbi:hypothetical protein [Clostridium manihotivorum]|uniref:Uncharacterized protein n=1 Tax=Clostridium manihotivorum TaxID=2320868 RepID=A0A3R5QXI4_9CLOT|nr:hypothetical protein [Clostridium manihotivorum]QAA34558.1 hypothetical protein C1I91_24610 [Clostridium manihotivorum]
MAIKIKVAKVHESQLGDEEIKREVSEVQEFFNTTDFQYSEGTINFVMLRGIYTHVKRSMLIVGVYVNKTDKCIHGISSELNLKFKNLNAQILTIETMFPEEFIGKLDVDEGLLIHIDVPVIGLDKDAIFNINDISGGLSNVKLII